MSKKLFPYDTHRPFPSAHSVLETFDLADAKEDWARPIQQELAQYICDLEQRLEAAERMLQESDSINLDILRKAQTAARIEELEWVCGHINVGFEIDENIILKRIAELKEGK